MWIAPAMKAVAAAQLFPANTHVLLMSDDELRRRMRAVRAAFDTAVAQSGAPSRVDFLHAFAVKANPLEAVVRIAQEEGFAAEVASMGELALAERVYGAATDYIIFDSPAKTLEELHHALQLPCYLNLDNFDELERVVHLSAGTIPGFSPIQLRATIGIRVNPQTVQVSQNAALATGGLISKFGISLHDAGNKERIVDAFVRYHHVINLRMLHLHSGSQGLSLDTMVAGVKCIVEELAEDPRIAPFVEVIDIGGGFPVDFSTDEETLSMHDYTTALRTAVPALFQPSRARKVLTEFGRAIAAKAGILASRVEYVKQSGGRQILLQHIGADLAVRTVWQPEKWPLRVVLFNEDGDIKTELPNPPDRLTDVCGPCCNSGCTLTRAAPLPTTVIPLRDIIVVHDVGAYYHSSFCLYNLRQMPACYLYRPNSAVPLICIKKPQTVQETLQLFTTD